MADAASKAMAKYEAAAEKMKAVRGKLNALVGEKPVDALIHAGTSTVIGGAGTSLMGYVDGRLGTDKVRHPAAYGGVAIGVVTAGIGGFTKSPMAISAGAGLVQAGAYPLLYLATYHAGADARAKAAAAAPAPTATPASSVP